MAAGHDYDAYAALRRYFALAGASAAQDHAERALLERPFSPHYDRERFTFDQSYVKAVNKVFVALYNIFAKARSTGFASAVRSWKSASDAKGWRLRSATMRPPPARSMPGRAPRLIRKVPNTLTSNTRHHSAGSC